MAQHRASSPHHQILIVEDDQSTREAIDALLTADGYTVVTARDGEDALTQLRAGTRPCLIILDMYMPRMDGWEFREAQIRDPDLSGIPTIAYSADGGLEERALALGLPFFQKTRVDTLLKIVRRYC
jgi:two-component system, chemotaxis family, chemotaxis protein CheY